MCSLQQSQENMVFGAKQSATYGSVQKSHQHMVLRAIFSKILKYEILTKG
jgi:hypothetical protein